MRSIKYIYRIGHGPSSSHTMGPETAAKILKREYPQADNYKVILYGSLALTGRGHGTDRILHKNLKDLKLVFDIETEISESPNTMDLFAYQGTKELGHFRAYSIGGGSIRIEGEKTHLEKDVYPHRYLTDIINYCHNNNLSLADYVKKYEEEDIIERITSVWKVMQEAVESGISKDGEIPGGLHVKRKAKYIYKAFEKENYKDRERLISAFAFAVSEENACNGLISTAPTCGSCGVIPAVLYYQKHFGHKNDEDIINSLLVAGLIGAIVKENASLSGAECGCQAEIGTACSMAAAALAYLDNYSMEQLECAAEIAMEHHLGLTCDPVKGLVQIPCIERNAIGAMRAFDAVVLAAYVTNDHLVSFDTVVETMYQTGLDIDARYRETAKAGLSKFYKVS